MHKAILAFVAAATEFCIAYSKDGANVETIIITKKKLEETLAELFNYEHEFSPLEMDMTQAGLEHVQEMYRGACLDHGLTDNTEEFLPQY